jgi:hypothetical protein
MTYRIRGQPTATQMHINHNKTTYGGNKFMQLFKKRALSLVLAVLLLISFVPFATQTAHATEPTLATGSTSALGTGLKYTSADTIAIGDTVTVKVFTNSSCFEVNYDTVMEEEFYAGATTDYFYAGVFFYSSAKLNYESINWNTAVTLTNNVMGTYGVTHVEPENIPVDSQTRAAINNVTGLFAASSGITTFSDYLYEVTFTAKASGTLTDALFYIPYKVANMQVYVTPGEGGGSATTPLTAPVLSGSSKTDTSVTVTAPDASTQDTGATVEYAKSSDSGATWGSWQTGATFSGLAASTLYQFKARYVAVTTATWSDSTDSNVISVTTNAASAAYTVSAVSDATPTGGGANFTVDVKVSATAATNFAPLQFDFTYDSSKVTFVSGVRHSGLSDPSSVIVGEPTGTGDIKIITISHQGATLSATSGGVSVATLTFTPLTTAAATTATFAIVNPQIGVSGTPNALTGTGGATAGTDKVVNISAGSAPAPAAPVITTRENWSGAPTGYALLVLTSTTDPEQGYTYGTSQLYYSSKMSEVASTTAGEPRYVYVDIITNGTLNPQSLWTPSAIHEEARGGFSKLSITYDGKINNDAVVDIFDAQIVYDLSVTPKKYSPSSPGEFLTNQGGLAKLERLKADVNGDGEITAADARAIQWFYHYGNWNVQP